MGIRIIFEDDMIRDIKDLQAALLIQHVLDVLEIEFQKIVIESTEDDQLDVVGLSNEELKWWR